MDIPESTLGLLVSSDFSVTSECDGSAFSEDETAEAAIIKHG